MASPHGDNPFRVPTDEEIFLLREQEETAKDQRGGAGSGDAGAGMQRRRESTNLHAFVEKKRQMFLVQMSLDIKRDEIRKLDERARTKNEALRKSEIMLEEDATRFDSFLRDNDQRTLNAIKIADEAYKRRQAAQLELKKRQAMIQQVQAEISKLTDQRDMCLKYKDFLDSLTPQEFFETARDKKRERQEERRRQRGEVQVQQWREARALAAQQFEQGMEPQVQELMVKGLSRKKAEERVRASRPPTPPPPKMGDVDLTSSGEDLPMYFVEPRQLFAIFSNLEEETLFLIQHNQETSHALEVLAESSEEKKKALYTQIETLQTQEQELRQHIGAVEGKAGALDEQMKASDVDDPNRIFLAKLQKHVLEVYRGCGFSQQKDILGMLADLEGRLEELLLAMNSMPQEFVRDVEKRLQLQRREAQRELHAQEQLHAHELKLEAQKRRAQQPVHVKRGKTIMFRTKPPERGRVVQVSEVDKEEERIEKRYFSGLD